MPVCRAVRPTLVTASGLMSIERRQFTRISSHAMAMLDLPDHNGDHGREQQYTTNQNPHANSFQHGHFGICGPRICGV